MPRAKTPKEFNNNTMTRSQFFAMIRSALRAKSRWWRPIQECKKDARRPYKGPNKRLKWEFQCSACKQWHPDKFVEVDHIIPAGQLNDYNDLPEFVKRLFVEKDGLAVLCKTCHQLKTNKERKNKK